MFQLTAMIESLAAKNYKKKKKIEISLQIKHWDMARLYDANQLLEQDPSTFDILEKYGCIFCCHDVLWFWLIALLINICGTNDLQKNWNLLL